MSHHDRIKNKVPGRITLVVISLMFLGLYAYAYQIVPEGRSREELLGAIIISSLWGGVFVLAMWFEKNWARFAMAGLLSLQLVLSLPIFVESLQLNTPLPPIYPMGALIHIVALAAVLFLPAIRELTYKKR